MLSQDGMARTLSRTQPICSIRCELSLPEVSHTRSLLRIFWERGPGSWFSSSASTDSHHMLLRVSSFSHSESGNSHTDQRSSTLRHFLRPYPRRPTFYILREQCHVTRCTECFVHGMDRSFAHTHHQSELWLQDV